MFLMRRSFATAKIHYPFFYAQDYTELEYSPYYAQKALKLNIDKLNIHQAGYEWLPAFLIQQIEDDKCSFIKEKEILFIGRSNCGKSSLINKVFENRKIARVAKAQGTTKHLHFHHIQHQDCLVVDAPGYGFAKMNKRRRHMWYGLVEDYLKISSRLSQIMLCINFEHGLKELDRLFLERADKFNIPIQVIFTKVDKIPPSRYFAQVQSITEELKRMELKTLDKRVLAVSVKDNFGMEMVKMRIVEAIEKSEPRNIDKKEDLLLSYIKEMRVDPTDMREKQIQQSKEYIVRKLIYNSKLSKWLQ